MPEEAVVCQANLRRGESTTELSPCRETRHTHTHTKLSRRLGAHGVQVSGGVEAQERAEKISMITTPNCALQDNQTDTTAMH